uniref:Uncharacterized protein n=1 Tax=Ascaris lumbricoides TaxID=6252 RepID=A0A0M3HMR2_ASCLU
MIKSCAHRDDAEAVGGGGRLTTRNNTSESSVYLASAQGSNGANSLCAKAEEDEVQVEVADDAGTRTTSRGQIPLAAHKNTPTSFDLSPSTDAAHTVSVYLAPSKSESDQNRLGSTSAYLAPSQGASSTTSTYLAPQQPNRVSMETEPLKIRSGSASVYLAPSQGASSTTSTYLAPQQGNLSATVNEPLKIRSGSASVYLAPSQGASSTTSTYLAPQQGNLSATVNEPLKIRSGSASVYLAPSQGASNTTSTYLAPQQGNLAAMKSEFPAISSDSKSFYLAPSQGAIGTTSIYLAPQQNSLEATESVPTAIRSGSESVNLAPGQGSSGTTSAYLAPQKCSLRAVESAFPSIGSGATSVYLAPSRGAESTKSTYLATRQHALGNLENSFPANNSRQESGGVIANKFGSGPKSSYLMPGKGSLEITSLINADSDSFCSGRGHFNKAPTFPPMFPKQGTTLPPSFLSASTKQPNKNADVPSVSQNDDSSTRTAVNIFTVPTQATSRAVSTSALPADVKRQVSDKKHDSLTTPLHRTSNQSTKTSEPIKQPSTTKNANLALTSEDDSSTRTAVNIPLHPGQSTSRVVSNTAHIAGRKQQVSDPKHVHLITRKLDSSTASSHLSTNSSTEGNRSRKQSSSNKNANLALSYQDNSSTHSATKIFPLPATVRSKVLSSTNLTGHPKQQASYTDHVHLSAQKGGTSRAPIHPKKKAAVSTGNNIVKNVPLQHSGNANVFPNLISKQSAEHLLGEGKANVKKKHGKSKHKSNSSSSTNSITIDAHASSCNKSSSNSKNIKH